MEVTMLDKKEHTAEDAEEIIIRRFRRDPKTGELMDAHKFGYKGWPIRVSRKKRVDNPADARPDNEG